jgi:predicted anti-sigma-YlaC factor YlaD
MTNAQSRHKRLDRILMRMPLMLTCQEAEAFIHDYLEGNLARRQRAIFVLHLRMCRECRDYLAAYRKSIELGQAVFSDPDAQVPDDMPEDLIAAILDAREK